MVALALAGFGAWWLATQRVGKQIDAFSQLPPGAIVKIDEHIDGCFRADHYTFVFHPGEHPTVEVKSILFPSNKTFDLGTLSLTRDDVRGLDLALNWYRVLKPGGCTTVESVTYTEITDGQVIAREQHVDSECANQVALENKGVLRFERIVWRAKAASHKPSASRSN